MDHKACKEHPQPPQRCQHDGLEAVELDVATIGEVHDCNGEEITLLLPSCGSFYTELIGIISFQPNVAPSVPETYVINPAFVILVTNPGFQTVPKGSEAATGRPGCKGLFRALDLEDANPPITCRGLQFLHRDSHGTPQACHPDSKGHQPACRMPRPGDPKTRAARHWLN